MENLRLNREAAADSQLKSVRGVMSRLTDRLEAAKRWQHRLDLCLFALVSVGMVLAYVVFHNQAVGSGRSGQDSVPFAVDTLVCEWLSRQARAFCGHLKDCAASASHANKFSVARGSQIAPSSYLSLPYSYAIIGDMGSWVAASVSRVVPLYPQAHCACLLLWTVAVPVAASLAIRWTGLAPTWLPKMCILRCLWVLRQPFTALLSEARGMWILLALHWAVFAAVSYCFPYLSWRMYCLSSPSSDNNGGRNNHMSVDNRWHKRVLESICCFNYRPVLLYILYPLVVFSFMFSFGSTSLLF